MHTLLLILVAAAGCGGSDRATTDRASEKQSVQPPAERPAPANSDQPDSSGAANEQSASEPVETAQAEDDASAKTAAAQPEQATVERFLLLAPGGPLVVELGLMIDGRPAVRQIERLAAQVVTAADADGDGTATWEEVTTSPKLRYGQFGNAPMPSAHARRDVIRRCDWNRDGVLNPEEVPRFLSQQGAASELFSFVAAARTASNNCWQWLNTTKDGILTSEELAAAAQRLRSRDGDDNEMLLPAELSDEMPTAMPRPSRRQELAVVLDDSIEWGTLLVKLEDRYGSLEPETFSLVPELFKQLDADGDGSLDKQELAALLKVPPHLELSATFGSAPDASPAEPTLHLNRVCDALSTKVAVLWERGDGVSLRLPGGKMAFTASDPPGATNDEATKQQFAAYDSDSNGYLDEKEAEAARPILMVPFEVADTDNDGKVYLAEAVAYQQQRQAIQHCLVQGTVAESDDAMFAALDVDDDGRLGAREIASAEQRLRSFDADGDGRLSANEIPPSFLVRFTQGNTPMGMAVRNDTYAAAAPPAREAPRWFTAMDVNSDGDISPREFLGTSEQFHELDANGDGFIDPTESTVK